MVFLIVFRYLHGNIELPVTIMLMVFAFHLFRPGTNIRFIDKPNSIMEACLNRYEALKEIDTLQDGENDTKVKRFDIEFQNVSFSYGEEEVIHDVSFNVPEQSMTALVGYSGSGKSTIANLIVRLLGCTTRFCDSRRNQCKRINL